MAHRSSNQSLALPGVEDVQPVVAYAGGSPQHSELWVRSLSYDKNSYSQVMHELCLISPSITRE